MRTTLDIEDDALAILRNHAGERGVSLGRAASDLIRNGSRFQLSTRQVNGLPVFDVPDDFPVVTAELVSSLSEDE